MFNKPHNSIVTLAAVLLALVGVSKPAKAFLLAQADVTSTTFTVPDKLPAEAKVDLATSNSTSSINQGLKESFTGKYPDAKVNIATQSSADALQELSEGKVDLVGIGRNLTATEKQKGFVAVPVSREKIAIVISKDNPYDGNLTISQFAQIFRGEITDWSEIGGNPGAINLVDSPDTNDTRQAFPSYPVFQESEFIAGSNSVKLDEDSTDKMVAQLGANGMGYAVANDVINRDDVKIVTMHQTQPDDERYPFSQPFYLVYQGTPSAATEAFLGFATEQGGEDVVANRVGSMSTAAAVAIASQLGNKPDGSPSGAVDLPETTVDGKGDIVEPNVDTNAGDADVDVDPGANPDAVAGDADVDVTPDANPDAVAGDADADVDVDPGANPDAVAGDADVDVTPDANPDVVVGDADVDVTPGANPDAVAQADADIEDSGKVSSDVEDSGKLNPDIEGSGEINPDIEGSGEINPDIEGSGEINPDVEGSGEINPGVEGSGEPNAAVDADGSGDAAPSTAAIDSEDEEAVATEKKGKWWWWLPLILGIPVLAAIAVIGFGGKKRSDKEPAVGDAPDLNPNGGGGVAGVPPNEDFSMVGANRATELGNVASNGVNTTSKLGGGAVAGGAAAIGGAAAANFVGGKRTTEDRIDRVELDDIELDDTNIDNSTVDEIPSTPVTEFTGQETKLQVTDQATKLQGNVTEDINENTSGLLDGISNTGAVAGGAAVGGAASGLISDRNSASDEDISDLTDNEDQTYTQTGFVSEQTTNLQTTDLDSDFDTGIELDGTETSVGKEFRGDYVLDEETTTGSFVETDTDIEGVDLDSNISDDSDNVDTNISGFTSDSASSVETSELDTDIEIEGDSTDKSSSGWLDGMSNRGGAAAAGGAAAIGGAAAAASGFFGNRVPQESAADRSTVENTPAAEDVTSEPTEIPELDTDIEEVNLDSNISGDLDDFDTNISGFTSDSGSSVETPELDTDIERDTTDNNPSGWLDGISDRGSAAAGGTAAIGGAAAAASGFFGNRDRSTAENTSAAEDVTSEPTGISEVDSDFEGVNLDSDISDVDANVSGFTSDSVGSVETSELDTDLEIEVDTTDNNSSGWLDGISEKGSAAAAGGTAAIGGAAAAASGFFGNRDRSTVENTPTAEDVTSEPTEILNIQDASVENDTSVYQSTKGSFADSIIADAESTSENLDTSLDEITFDDTSNPTELSLDEITFDDTDNSAELSLDEITFDDADNSAELSLDEINFDDTDNSAELSLDEINFDDTDNSAELSLDEINFDDTDNSTELSLDEINFDDTDNSGTANLEKTSSNRTSNIADISLDEITFDNTSNSTDIGLDDITFSDTEDNSIDELMDSIDDTTKDPDISLDDLGFNKSSNDSNSDLLSSNAAKINDPSEQSSDDMNNISTWLDSLETPSQNSEDISGWLDKLDVQSNDSKNDNFNSQKVADSEDETEDISFQFLEDLLERDSKKDKDN